MARQRTQKTISARIDRTYIKRPSPWRRMRRSIIFMAVAGAILFVAFTTVGGGQGDWGEWIHNPGRLTFSHASFENNCAACHDGCDQQGKPTGKFSLAVSDSACLKCHDAGVHNANQATQVMVDMSRHPPEQRSADCASCHVEHRGQTALISASDLQCLSCHSDLTGKTMRPPQTPLHVTAFTLDGHPHFGRSLMKDGKVVNPTNLRFNHKKHMGLLTGAQQQCTFCHDPDPDAAKSMVWEVGKSAFSEPGGSAAAAPQPLQDGTGRHRSLTQVNYARNCEGCHALDKLPGSDIPIPHEDLSLVRQAILAYVTDAGAPWQKFVPDKTGAKEKPLNDRFAAKLSESLFSPDYSDAAAAVTAAVKSSPIYTAIPTDSKLPADLATKLSAAAAKLPTSVLPAADRARVQAVIAATTQPAGHLRPLIIARLRAAAVAGTSGAAKQKTLDEFDAVFARLNQDTPDPRLVEAYVVYANALGASCVKCHDVQGDATAIPSEWAALPAKTAPSADAAAPPPFCTVPTGIPAGPRQWYTASEFSHDAHRRMDCVECHTAALTSEKTSDVLSPDIQWQGLAFTDAARTTMVPATRSCTECHHADNSDGAGAAANCTECHTYHDRSHEHPTTSTPAEVLSGKALPAAPKQVAAAGP